jgi:Surface antigen variable number repeat/TonB C terminal
MMTAIKKRVLLMILIFAIACAVFTVGTICRAQQSATVQDKTEPPTVGGALEMLTPTGGVDFTTYLAHLLSAVKRNWYAKMPVEAKIGDKGKTAVHFKIQRDGTLVGPAMTWVEISSGNEALDNAAVAAIQASTPFEHLPESFKGPNIELRLSFFYNVPLTDGDAAQTPTTVSRIVFEGNRRVSSETVRGLIFLTPGDRYNEESLQADLQALRSKPYFESVSLEVQDDPIHPNAKIVIFHLIEKPASGTNAPSNGSQ